MSSSFLSTLARVELAPPRYLSLPTAGIDISASGVKAIAIKETLHGLEVSGYSETRVPIGAREDRGVVSVAIVTARKQLGVVCANIMLPESRGYLFEASVSGSSPHEWRTQVERKLEEYVPLPRAEVQFDLVPLTKIGESTQIVGVGYSRKVVMAAVDEVERAGLAVRAVESEIFALPRAVLPADSTETVMLIDIGRTTTKLSIVTRRIPRLATTIDIGGHALTLAVQKYFGVTEEETRRIKEMQGLAVEAGNEDFHAAMLATVSAIREEITRRLEYWQTRSSPGTVREPVTRAVLVGGNATLHGLPEYLAAGLEIPVERGDVFKNFASKNHWLPPLEHAEALTFGTAIGLALRDHEH